MNGENDLAVLHWKNAVNIAHETNESPSAELAEVYYCLGKSLSDARCDEDAAVYLQEAVKMLAGLEEAERHKTAQYELAQVLNRLGTSQESAVLFRQAYGMAEPVPVETIPLKSAIQVLQKQGLAAELKGGVFSNLCHRLNIHMDGHNQDIVDLLVLYYSEENHGHKRATKDRFFFSDYTTFDTEDVLERLNALSGVQNLLKLEEQEGDTADGDFITVTLKRFDGETVFRSCSSVVGLVDEYSNQLAFAGSDLRCCTVDGGSVYLAAYLIPVSIRNAIHNAKALRFEDTDSE